MELKVIKQARSGYDPIFKFFIDGDEYTDACRITETLCQCTLATRDGIFGQQTMISRGTNLVNIEFEHRIQYDVSAFEMAKEIASRVEAVKLKFEQNFPSVHQVATIEI